MDMKAESPARGASGMLPRSPILCLVTDRGACLDRPLEGGGAGGGQGGGEPGPAQAEGVARGELLELGRRVMARAHECGAALVVNDRLDVAMAMGADGVHLGGGSLPVGEVRRLVSGGMLVGASVHSLEEAVRAEGDGADYLVLGTIFETASHPGRAPAGLDLVARVTSAVRIPVIAIGGITAGNARSVMDAGASGVAVIRAIQSADDVAGAARSLLRAMGGTSEGNGPSSQGHQETRRSCLLGRALLRSAHPGRC